MKRKLQQKNNMLFQQEQVVLLRSKKNCERTNFCHISTLVSSRTCGFQQRSVRSMEMSHIFLLLRHTGDRDAAELRETTHVTYKILQELARKENKCKKFKINNSLFLFLNEKRNITLVYSIYCQQKSKIWRWQ